MRSLFASSRGMVRASVLILLLGAVVAFVYWTNRSGAKVLTQNLSEPLSGATTAKVDINAGDGNLTIERLTGGEPMLVSGTLQYLENQDAPTRALEPRDGQASLTLQAGQAGQPGFRLPWSGCNGATEWQIQLNPAAVADLAAHSNGGNVRLNLAGTAVRHVSADTGGGNMDVVLPDNITNLDVTVKTGGGDVTVASGSGILGSSHLNADSGAGNVVVRIPNGVAARIHATTGLGKVRVDPRFSRTDDNTYQSSDFESAADKVEFTLHSGMGDVLVNTR